MVVAPFLRCDLCDKEFSGPEPYAQHLTCRAHLNRSSEAQASTSQSHAYDTVPPTSTSQQYRCDVCDVFMSGQVSYDQHMNGSKHKSQVNKDRILKETVPELTATSSPEPLNPDNLNCQVCGKNFSGPESYEQHLVSRKHQRKVAMEDMKTRLTNPQPASCPPAPDASSQAEMQEVVSKPPQANGNLYPSLQPLRSEMIPSRATAKNDSPKKPTGCWLFNCFGAKKNSKDLEKKSEDLEKKSKDVQKKDKNVQKK